MSICDAAPLEIAFQQNLIGDHYLSTRCSLQRKVDFHEAFRGVLRHYRLLTAPSDQTRASCP
jgi:hypothetical protein